MKVYPNSSPEFRYIRKPDNSLILQVRYVCESQGYKSKWQDIPIVEDVND